MHAHTFWSCQRRYRRVASALALWLFASAFAVAAAQPADEVRWLIAPARDLSGEGPTGIEVATTRALAGALAAVPTWKVRVHDPGAQAVQTALRQGLLIEAETTTVPDRVSAERVGLLWKADVVLVPILVRREQSAVLVLNAISVVGRQVAGPGKRVDLPQSESSAVGVSAEELADRLAHGVAERLAVLLKENPVLWHPDPQAAQDWAAEGEEHVAAGRFRDAALAYEAATRVAPDKSAYRRALAQSLVSLGQPNAAREHIEQALQRDPKDVELLLMRADIHLALGNPGRALGDFQSAAQVAKDDIRAQEGIARARLALGDAAFALRDYEKLAARSPDSALVHRGYGEAWLQNNRPDKALVELRRATELDPADRATRESLANLMLRNGKLAEGVEELRVLTDQSKASLAYADTDYRRMMRYLAEEFELVADSGEDALDDYRRGALSQPQFISGTQMLHRRSDNLARVLERTMAPPDFDRSLRYWVLAATLLNQSDFEASRYASKGGQERMRSAELYRESARQAARQARVLASPETRIQVITPATTP